MRPSKLSFPTSSFVGLAYTLRATSARLTILGDNERGRVGGIKLSEESRTGSGEALKFMGCGWLLEATLEVPSEWIGDLLWVCGFESCTVHKRMRR